MQGQQWSPAPGFFPYGGTPLGSPMQGTPYRTNQDEDGPAPFPIAVPPPYSPFQAPPAGRVAGVPSPFPGASAGGSAGPQAHPGHTSSPWGSTLWGADGQPQSWLQAAGILAQVGEAGRLVSHAIGRDTVGPTPEQLASLAAAYGAGYADGALPGQQPQGLPQSQAQAQGQGLGMGLGLPPGTPTAGLADAQARGWGPAQGQAAQPLEGGSAFGAGVPGPRGQGAGGPWYTAGLSAASVSGLPDLQEAVEAQRFSLSGGPLYSHPPSQVLASPFFFLLLPLGFRGERMLLASRHHRLAACAPFICL